uniref:Uncharacterized protein n=1 Tax=Gorilla gorilla gorilla TaxID=9595 RepID=A0A2I2YHA0_GORGO
MGTWWHRETYLATFSATLLTQLHPTLLTQVHPLLLSFPQRTGSRAWWVFATLGASSAAPHLSLFSPKLVFLTIIVVGGGQMLKVEADLEKETHGVTVRLCAEPSLSTSSGPASCSEVSAVRR